ncbi:hypothetical protein [Candidatus Regiella insecticola]|uniref:hypothetical protein n=1 Tax=Candidatus Regiella insecticola TaxID=138073 RepID=UPI00159E2199|nr:hypothetical protein [Candidatus Regiella insecticola]
MSVDILRDSASTRRQQSRNLKGEGYKLAPLVVNRLSLLPLRCDLLTISLAFHLYQLQPSL